MFFRYGCTHEETTRSAYMKARGPLHGNLKVADAGFRISTLYPLIGASLDGYVTCNCCAQPGILEIKCPLCAKSGTDLTADEMKGFCLKRNEQNILTLDKEHTYFYQVQMQLFVTNSSFCDFIVWLENDQEFFIEHIEPDIEFFQQNLDKVRDFFSRKPFCLNY